MLPRIDRFSIFFTSRRGSRGHMLQFILCLSGLFEAYGSNATEYLLEKYITQSKSEKNGNQFISDVMLSREVHQCDFGYVFDHQKPKISFELLNSLERWQILVKSSNCLKRNILLQAILDEGNYGKSYI